MNMAKEEISDEVKLLMEFQQRLARIEENTKNTSNLVDKVDEIADQSAKAQHAAEEANLRINSLRDVTYGMVAFIALYIVAPLVVDLVSKYL